MSISTKRGDAGQTGLAGGIRISKADLRVEAYGSVDELNTVLGFARSICHNQEICLLYTSSGCSSDADGTDGGHNRLVDTRRQRQRQ